MSNWGTLNHHHPFCYYRILQTPLICREMEEFSHFFNEIENGYQESRKSNYYVAKMRVGCKNPDFLCRIGNDTFAICTHLFLELNFWTQYILLQMKQDGVGGNEKKDSKNKTSFRNMHFYDCVASFCNCCCLQKCFLFLLWQLCFRQHQTQAPSQEMLRFYLFQQKFL